LRRAAVAGVRGEAGSVHVRLPDDVRRHARAAGRRFLRGPAAPLDLSGGRDLRGAAGHRGAASPGVGRGAHGGGAGLLDAAGPSRPRARRWEELAPGPGVRGGAGRGPVALLRGVRRGVGGDGALGGLLRDPEEVAGAGKGGRASVQSTEAPHHEAPRIGLAVSATPVVSPPKLGRWQALEFAERGALALEDRVGGRRTPLELVSPRASGGLAERALAFPEGYSPGRSEAVRGLCAEMAPLVGGDLPVLLVGETGVGKEELAHALHLSSARREGPFVAVNCAAIPTDLLEAEMF